MHEAKIEYLVPTKATLFGLDVRFRGIDQKLAEEKGTFKLQLFLSIHFR